MYRNKDRKLSFESLENRLLLAVTSGVKISSLADTVEIVPSSTSAVEIPINTDVMKLHSNKGANHTIYLDFDGHKVTGTQWNTDYKASVITIPRFNLDGNSSKTAFSVEEQQAIYEAWLEVAEDFMPFNVDVTTEFPGTSVLSSAGSIRVCIGGNGGWYPQSSSYTGVAYDGSFSLNSDTPCFVFSEKLTTTHAIAMTISHELGHSFNLGHDGQKVGSTVNEYYSGAAGWGPIMGTPSFQTLVQWSRGEYEGATNTQDDLQIISTYLGYRTDDYGNTQTSAQSLKLSGGAVTVKGIIEQNTDYDYFSFTAAAGTCYIEASVIESVSNLNTALYVYNSSGKLVASSASSSILSSSLNFTAEKGTYYVCVTGIGKGTPVKGIYADGDYSDYASLGSYTLTIRDMTAGITVTTEKDIVSAYDGVVSLREAITAVGNNGVILFDSSLNGKTIILGGSELRISSNISIDASSLINGITVSGNSQSRIFTVTNSGDLTLTNLSLINGYAESGGAISNNGGKVTLNQCTLQNNKSYSSNGDEDNLKKAGGGGGGIYNINDGIVTITDCQIAANSAVRKGGAVYNFNGKVLVYRSAFSENTADVNGGVFDSEYNGTIEITGSTFSANTALQGGVFYLGEAATTKAVNSLFVKNASKKGSSSGYGGVFLLLWSNGFVELRNCTISQNQAYQGGAIYTNGIVRIYNTIITNNTAGQGNNDIQIGSYGKIYGYNTLSSFTKWTSKENCLAYKSNLPLFTDSQSGNYRLAQNSQAIDKGNNSYISGYETDLDGNPRIKDSTVDLGAYEYGIQPLNIQFTGSSSVYDGLQHTASLTGTLSTDTIVYTYNGKTYSSLPSFKDVGTYTITVSVTRSSETVTKSADVVITQKTLTVTGTKVSNKVYDSTTDAEITIGTINGIVSGDSVSIKASGYFASSDAGNQNVIVNYSLTGSSSNNYTITGTTLSAVINPKPLTVTGTKVASKIYDVTTDAEITIGTVDGIISGDSVSVKASGEFESAAIGINKKVTVAYTLSGSSAQNYSIANETLYANITEKTSGSVVVNTIDDPDTWNTEDTTISLREAIKLVKDGEKIVFSNSLRGKTITLNGSALLINKKVIIDASSIGGITIDADIKSSVFDIKAGTEDNSVRFICLTITGGKTGYGGGIAANGSTAEWINCVITGNYAPNGGGIYSSGSVLTFVNCTITANSAKNGGGIYAAKSTLNFYNTLIVQNSAEKSGTDIYKSSAVINAFNTLSSFTDWTKYDSVYTYDSTLPLFTCWEDGDHTLTANSQALNRGNNIYIGGYDCDLCGNPRINNGTVDLGAYEYYPSITDVSVASWSGTYDGKAHSITVTDPNANTDTITYTYNGQTSMVNPAFTDPGTYTVTVTISRDGYKTWTDEAAVLIKPDQPAIKTKITITESVPTTAESAEPLSITQVGLGTEFCVSVWVKSNDPDYGIEGGYCSLYFSEGALPGKYIASPLYNDSIAAAMDNGHITKFGGFPQTKGIVYGAETWVLAGTYSFTASEIGTLSFRTDTATENGVPKPAQNFNLSNGENTNAYDTVTVEVTSSLETPAITTGSRNIYVSYGANRHLLQWNSVEGAAGYELAYSSDGKTWKSITTTDTQTVVTGLTYATEIMYHVRAVASETGYADSGWSEIKCFAVCPMDINNDGDIANPDRSILAYSWLAGEGDDNYTYYADINADGDIAIADRSFLSENWLNTVGEDKMLYPQPLKADLVFEDFSSLESEIFDDFFVEY